MADPTSSRGQQRRGRAWLSSRTSSARSSAIFDDQHLHPTAATAAAHHHPLRAAESRFSLHEQFAATRREYDFGYDDTSSILEKVSVASDAGGDGGPEDDTIRVDGLPGSGEGREDGDEVVEEDYYDLLCLPRDEPVTPQQVRAAYFRLFPLLHRDGRTPNAPAQAYFARVQRAFETLVDPGRRAEYDARDRTATLSDGGVFDEEAEDAIAYEAARTEQPWRASRDDGYTTSDLGVRFDVSRALRARPSWRSGSGSGSGRRARRLGVKPLDFTLSHSVTVGVPALGGLMEKRARSVYQLIRSKVAKAGGGIPVITGDKNPEASSYAEPDFHFRTPTLTVSGSVYGLTEDMYLTPISLLSDRYQPLLPQTIPRHRVIQLAENRMSPLVSLRLRQEISHKSWTGDDAQRGLTVIELDRDVLT